MLAKATYLEAFHRDAAAALLERFCELVPPD